jgi:hypothetical protein
MVWTDAGVAPTIEVPAGLEAVRRHVGHVSFLFLLNHRDGAVDVPLTAPGVNLLDGGDIHPGLFHIGPYGAAVIKEGW